jgi:hypothetical protein
MKMAGVEGRAGRMAWPMARDFYFAMMKKGLFKK